MYMVVEIKMYLNMVVVISHQQINMLLIPPESTPIWNMHVSE